MGIQCETLSTHRAAQFRSTNWLHRARVFIAHGRAAWLRQRRVKRSLRVLESLPEQILHDIGWPTLNDRLPDAPNRPLDKRC